MSVILRRDENWNIRNDRESKRKKNLILTSKYKGSEKRASKKARLKFRIPFIR